MDLDDLKWWRSRTLAESAERHVQTTSEIASRLPEYETDPEFTRKGVADVLLWLKEQELVIRVGRAYNPDTGRLEVAWSVTKKGRMALLAKARI